MRACNNINTIVKTTGGDEYSPNGKSESPNSTLDNIKRTLLLNSNNKKELWCLAYHYAIWISLQTENSMCRDVLYFLCHVSITSYKHINIWGVRFYTINVHVTINKLDNISHRDYFMGCVPTTEVII